MRIVVDGQALQGPSRHRGIGRYSSCLLRALAEIEDGIELVVHEDLPAPAAVGVPPERQWAFRPPLPREVRSRAANELYYADWLTALHPDLVLLLSPFDLELLHPRFIGASPPTAALVYDLIPLLFAHHYLTAPEQLTAYARSAQRVCAVDLILAISRATASDVKALLGDTRGSVLAIGGAPDPGFAPLASDQVEIVRQRLARRFGIQREFILYVGGAEPRKNMIASVLAFEALPSAIREGLELVIACEMEPVFRGHFLETVRSLGVGDQVRVTGFVDEDDLRGLYQACRVFFFPSLYEGLGLPIIEALRCGAPVVASNRSAMPEVAGPVSWLADPYEVPDLARALSEALETPRARGADERIRWASGFEWGGIAERSLAAFRTIVGPLRRPMRTRSATRPRVAWVSPLPPARSGISDYSAELLAHLSALFELELVIDPDQPPVDAELASRHVIVPAPDLELRHEARPFDLFVYQLGASTFHLYMLPLLTRFPGMLVLHEFMLTGLAREAKKLGIWPGGAGSDEPHPVDHDAAGPPLLAAADVVLVHTRDAWQRARGACNKPVVHVPHAIPSPEIRSPSQERRRLGLPEDAFVVVTLGRVGPLKRISSVLQAMTTLPPDLRARTLLLIVGDVDEGERERLGRQAAELGLAGSVRFTGRVPLDDFGAHARAADACVQLRYPTQGEASGSLLRALASGAACVVSDQGSFGELSEAVALRVRTPDHEVEDLRSALLRIHEEAGLSASLRAAAIRFTREERSLEALAPRYAAAMELAIGRRAARGGLWAEQAIDALAHSGEDAPPALIRHWAELRAGSGPSPQAAAAGDS